MQNIIPDGVYEEDSGFMHMIVDNSKGTISSVLMGEVAAIYRYSISNGVVTMVSIKDGVNLYNNITIYSNPVKSKSGFELQPDNATFRYISPLV